MSSEEPSRSPYEMWALLKSSLGHCPGSADLCQGPEGENPKRGPPGLPGSEECLWSRAGPHSSLSCWPEVSAEASGAVSPGSHTVPFLKEALSPEPGEQSLLALVSGAKGDFGVPRTSRPEAPSGGRGVPSQGHSAWCSSRPDPCAVRGEEGPPVLAQSSVVI